jgi:biopolymer transport protein TolQ
MEPTVNAAAEIAAGGYDFSVFELFFRADWVVKSVMIVLAFASIWSWAIIFQKVVSLARLNSHAGRFENAFWSGGAVDDLYDRMANNPRDPLSAVFLAGMREWRRAEERDTRGEGFTLALAERIDRVMHVTANRELERLHRYMTFLASTGATAPFIGLFGTVWGIMNSFHAIGASKSTSLAVVAPGIAEALFATALGLFAAIPAVLAYNKLSRDLDSYASRVTLFTGEFMAILSRKIDEGQRT